VNEIAFVELGECEWWQNAAERKLRKLVAAYFNIHPKFSQYFLQLLLY
jgi:hypothetical protein